MKERTFILVKDETKNCSYFFMLYHVTHRVRILKFFMPELTGPALLEVLNVGFHKSIQDKISLTRRKEEQRSNNENPTIVDPYALFSPYLL
jgi:hypothetical protein